MLVKIQSLENGIVELEVELFECEGCESTITEGHSTHPSYRGKVFCDKDSTDCLEDYISEQLEDECDYPKVECSDGSCMETDNLYDTDDGIKCEKHLIRDILVDSTEVSLEEQIHDALAETENKASEEEIKRVVNKFEEIVEEWEEGEDIRELEQSIKDAEATMKAIQQKIQDLNTEQFTKRFEIDKMERELDKMKSQK